MSSTPSSPSVSAFAAQGPRNHMEDTIIVGELKGRLFSVFDGHGGSSVSAYLERHLATAVEAALGEQSTYVCVCVCVRVCVY